MSSRLSFKRLLKRKQEGTQDRRGCPPDLVFTISIEVNIHGDAEQNPSFDSFIPSIHEQGERHLKDLCDFGSMRRQRRQSFSGCDDRGDGKSRWRFVLIEQPQDVDNFAWEADLLFEVVSRMA